MINNSRIASFCSEGDSKYAVFRSKNVATRYVESNPTSLSWKPIICLKRLRNSFANEFGTSPNSCHRFDGCKKQV